MKKWTLSALLFCSAVLVNAVPKGQPTMAVLPFQISRVQETVNIGNLKMTRNLVEKEFSNELINFLTKSRKFNMLSRTQIERIVDENNLTYSEWVKPGEAERIGQLLVADYLVTGVINRYEITAIQQNIKITGETTPRLVATFKCQFQIIETKSGKIVLADQIIKKLKSEDVRREVPASERKDWTLADYKDKLFEETALEVGNAILEGIYPVRIASVKDSLVVLNRGKGTGISIGDKLNVVSQGEPVVDPDTGETLGASEEEVGLIEITDVEVKFSKAKILQGEGKILVGNICRRVKGTRKSAAPAYPRATPGW